MINPPFVLIMAGGVGSRFWPVSREHLPKQFLDITGSGKTLIQMTFDRFASFIPVANIFIITNESYRQQTIEAVPEIAPENIITEPSRNNTAASIAYASLKLARKNSEAVCIVAPSDHVIENNLEFERIVRIAVQYAGDNNSIVTLGITPQRADSGYGYIEFDQADTSEIRKVKSFREKPDLEKANEYINAGNFTWNSGIFVWRLDYILEAFKKHAGQIYNVLIEGLEIYNTADEIAFIKQEYPRTEKISVDYAILEKAENVYTIPCDIGWSDLGTWNSLYDYSQKDINTNVVLAQPSYIEATSNSLILSNNSKLIVIKGLEDYIVVDTNDCLMIYPKSEEQNIKVLKDRLKEKDLDKYL